MCCWVGGAEADTRMIWLRNAMRSLPLPNLSNLYCALVDAWLRVAALAPTEPMTFAATAPIDLRLGPAFAPPCKQTQNCPLFGTNLLFDWQCTEGREGVLGHSSAAACASSRQTALLALEHACVGAIHASGRRAGRGLSEELTLVLS
jgi:hypothetical protein